MKYWLALSGGGFRATLFHLGVLRYLCETNKLTEVERIASVSGGSILATHFMLNRNEYCDTQRFASIANRLIQFTRKDVRGGVLTSWLLYTHLLPLITVLCGACIVVAGRVFAPHYAYCYYIAASLMLLAACIQVYMSRSRVHYLESQYDSLFESARIGALSEHPVDCHIACTNLTTGSLAWFNSSGLCCNADGALRALSRPSTPLAKAVAASSAFPPAFPPVRLEAKYLSDDTYEARTPEYFADGGVFDNSGLVSLFASTPTLPANTTVIECNAECPYEQFCSGTFALIYPRATRANDIMWERLTRYRAGSFKGLSLLTPIHLATPINERCDPEVQQHVRSVRTDLDAFTELEIQFLVLYGYAAASLAFNDVDRLSQRVAWSHSNVPYAQNGGWLPYSPGASGTPDSFFAKDPVKELASSSQVGLVGMLLSLRIVVATVVLAAISACLLWLLCWPPGCRPDDISLEVLKGKELIQWETSEYLAGSVKAVFDKSNTSGFTFVAKTKSLKELCHGRITAAYEAKVVVKTDVRFDVSVLLIGQGNDASSVTVLKRTLSQNDNTFTIPSCYHDEYIVFVGGVADASGKPSDVLEDAGLLLIKGN